jgi:hypothetical protein
MNTTILNYPGFHTLPKGVKQMLLLSEAHFFEQPAPHYVEQIEATQEKRSLRGLEDFFRRPLINVRIALEMPAG